MTKKSDMTFVQQGSADSLQREMKIFLYLFKREENCDYRWKD